MANRVIIPKIFRRGDYFTVRIQVPRELHERMGRKEYWISLKTSDKAEAMSLAIDAVKSKRNELDLELRRLRKQYRKVTQFSDDELLSLGREIYNAFMKQMDARAKAAKSKSPDEWSEFVASNEEYLEQMEIEIAREGFRHDFASALADDVLQENLLSVDQNGDTYKDVCKVAIDAALNVQRRIVSRMRGDELPSKLDQRFVDPFTGQTRDFTPIREQSPEPSASGMALGALIKKYANSPHSRKNEKTRKSIEGYLNVIAEILGETKDVRTITFLDCEKVAELIQRLPPNFSKLPKFSGLKIEQKADLADKLDMRRLSPTGVNNYIGRFSSFLRWCEGMTYIPKIPFKYELLRVYDPVSPEDKRLPFNDDEQLKTIFGSSVYTGRKRKTGLFWVPLIALLNGMRSNEICQLDAIDVRQENGIWGFDITHISSTGEDDKSTKTKDSVRFVPIHPKLIELGLLEFHNSRPNDGKLFSDISRGSDGYYSSTFSKRVNRHFKKIGVHGSKYKFHSLRHNFRDALRSGLVDPGIARALGGWTGSKTEAFEIYGRGYPLPQLYKELAKVRYPDEVFEHIEPLA